MGKIAKKAGVLLWLVCLLAPAAASGAEGYIPHITGSGGFWKTILQVDNSGAGEAAFRVVLYDDGRQVYENDFTVAGLGRAVIDLRDLAPVERGSGEVSSPSPDLGFRLNYESVPAGGIAEFLLSDDHHSSLGFYFTDYTPAIAWKAIAVNNPGDVPASITLHAVGAGSILGTADISLEAHSKTDGMYWRWFPDVEFGELKRIIAESDVPLTGVAISGNADNSLLLFTPGRETQPVLP